MMPTIETSTRKLDVSPSINYAPSHMGQIGNTIGGALHQAGNSIDHALNISRRADAHARVMAERKQREMEHMLDVRRRADERAADCAIVFAENTMANSLVGYDVDDGKGGMKHIQGVMEVDWRTLDRDKTTVNKMVEERINKVRDIDAYRELTPEQRRIFDRKWTIRADSYRAKGNEYSARLARKRAEEQSAQIIKDKSESVAFAYGDDDVSFTKAAEAGALGIYREKMGTGLNENTRTLIDNPTCTFDDVAKSEGWNEAQTAANKREYTKIITDFRVNRITAMMKSGAAGQFLGGYSPELALDKAEAEVDNLRKEGVINDDQANAILRENGKARKSLDNVNAETRRAEYSAKAEELGNVELDLLNPERVNKVALDYTTYEQNVRGNPMLDEAHKLQLLKQYRSLVSFKEKYDADLKKYEAESAKVDAANKEEAERVKREYGYFDEDTKRFVPASAFPKESDSGIYDEFLDKDSSVWSNPQKGLARLEGARLTGRISMKDYKVASEYGKMLMDDEARKWWTENYGKFSFDELVRMEYGEDGVKREVRKLRDRKHYTSASGIFAKNRGVKSAHLSVADMIEDSLKRDRETASVNTSVWGSFASGGKETYTEDLIPPETLEKVYATVRRLCRNGVDPASALQSLIAPVLASGVRRDINERLADTDYLNEVIENYRARGSSFNRGESAARGDKTFNDFRGAAMDNNLVRQGRMSIVNK